LKKEERIMFKRLLTLLVIALAISGAAIGCGGGSDRSSSVSSTITTSSLTKAEFIKKADAICAKGRQNTLPALAHYLQKHESSASSSIDEHERFAGAIKAVFLPEIENQIREISELGAPSGDEQRIETLLDTLQQKIDVIKGWRSIPSRFPVDREFRPAGELARDYDLVDCAYGERVPEN
jgi:hypothetical protein